MVPGAIFSTVTSAFFRSSLTSSRPLGDLRLIAIDRLLALNMWKYHGSSSGLPGLSRRPGSPVFGFSIFTTSAPSHASASVHDVPASNWVKSTTRTPARQLKSRAFSFIDGSSSPRGPRGPRPGHRLSIPFCGFTIRPRGSCDILAGRQLVALDLPGLSPVEDIAREIVGAGGQRLLATRGDRRVSFVEICSELGCLRGQIRL